MKAVLIKRNGVKSLVDIDGLEAMQAAVGGWVEAVPLPDCDLIINEEGISLDLPVNPMATRFAKERLRADGRVLLAPDGWILGDVLVVGQADDEGEGTDLPEKIIKELLP